MNAYMTFPWNREIPFEDRPDLYEFVLNLWKTQGKTNPFTCTGMCSFTFYKERILFDATRDVFYRL